MFLVCCIFFRSFADKGFDYHHSGVILSPALVVSHGGVLYRDAFSQYGPIPTYIQAGVFRLFDPSLYLLNILDCIINAASIAMLFKLWSKVFSTLVAGTSVALCIVTAYFIRPDMNMLAWPSSFVLFFATVGIFLLFMGFENQSYSRNNWLDFIAGISFGSIFWTRATTGVIVILAVLTLFLFSKARSHFLFVTFGVTAMLVAGFFFLYLSGSLQGWILQTIEWPQKWAGTFGTRGQSAILRGVFVEAPKAGLFVGVLIVLLKLNRSNCIKYCRVVVAFVALLGQISLTTNPISNIYFDGFNSLGFGNIRISQNLISWLVIDFVLVTLFYELLNMYKLKFGGVNGNFGKSILIFVSAGLLVGIYPAPDQGHIWWVLLPAFGPFVYFVQSQFDSPKRVRLFTLALVVSIGVPVIASGAENFRQTERVRVTQPPIFARMLEDKQNDLIHQEQFAMVQRIQERYGDRTLLPICEDSGYFAMGKSFQLPDAFYLYWKLNEQISLPGNLLSRSRRSFYRINQPIILFCPPFVDYQDFINEIGYKVIYQTPSTVDRIGWDLDSVIAIPISWDIVS